MESHFGLAIFWACKSGEREGGRGRAADFVAFGCTSQRKSGSRSRGLGGARGAVLALFYAVFESSCPGNEGCAAESKCSVMCLSPQHLQAWHRSICGGF